MKIPDAKAAVDKEWKKVETFLAWQWGKVKRKKEVVLEAQKKDKRIPLYCTHKCHLNAKLEPKLQKNRGRVAPWVDIVKEDSGASSVFTEQGSSASQMTAAKVVDVFARLSGCGGQSADAVSQLSKSECPDVGIRLPQHKWPKSWSSMEDPVVLLERNLYGHPLARLLWEGQYEKILLKH